MIRSLHDDDRAKQALVQRIDVFMIRASACRHEVPGFPALPKLQVTDLIHGRTVQIRGMTVGQHLVRHAIVLHEQHALADADLDGARIDALAGNGHNRLRWA